MSVSLGGRHSLAAHGLNRATLQKAPAARRLPAEGSPFRRDRPPGQIDGTIHGSIMIRRIAGVCRFGALALALGLMLASTGSVFAHARFVRADPPIDAPLDGAPVVLKTFYSQELTSRSTVRVLDANGVQVDLGDGRVDLDDPIRKTMLVSLPALSVGLYTIDYMADSAEDGHEYPGTAAFGVGMTPPSAEQPSIQPAGATEFGPSGLSLEMARPLAH